MPLVTKSDYARLRGCSPAYISKLLKSGRITEVDGKIDVEAANSSLERHADPARALTRKSPPTKPKGSPPEPVSGPSYASARAAHEAIKARMAKMEFDRRSGELVSVDKVKRQAARAGRVIRDAMLSIPDRISAVLAVESDERRVHDLLDAEITAALETVSANSATH